MSNGWVLAWWAMATLLLLAGGHAWWFAALAAFSLPIFDIHVHMADRVANNQKGAAGAIYSILAMLKQHRQTYLRSALLRGSIALACGAAWWSLLHLGGDLRQPNPPWFSLFGVEWAAWLWIGALPCVLQRHGITSFRSWIVRRMGADDDTSMRLHFLARRKNPNELLFLGFVLTGCWGLGVIFAPLLLPAIDLYHAAVMRCAWHDLFDGGTRIAEEAKQFSRQTKSNLSTARTSCRYS